MSRARQTCVVYDVDDFLRRLARAEIGATFNFYHEGERAPLLRQRLERYLEQRREAPFLLVGEAPGYRGARISGIPFTSERQLTGSGPAEASATIVQRTLTALGLSEQVLCWNVVPTHPGTATRNRRPTRVEIRASAPFLWELASGRRVVAVGRLAQEVLGCDVVRHPAHGGASLFEASLRQAVGSASVPR
jgi:uracil-DNA glycosylase family 4